MWYIDGHKCKPERYTQWLDDFQNNTAMVAEWGNFEDTEMLMEARCHGNPDLNTVGIGWHDSTAVKRAENDAYKGEAKSGEVVFDFKTGFQTVGRAQSIVEGSF